MIDPVSITSNRAKPALGRAMQGDGKLIRATISEIPRSAFENFKRFSIQRLEQAASRATDKASRAALTEIRQAMAGASIGKLGYSLKQFSDEKKGSVYRRGTEAFSASGGIAIRTRNERTVGAIESYTEGSEIVPLKGHYLWFATNEIPSRAGRRKMTPELYRKFGLEKKIGPLILVRGINGKPLLVVKNASVNAEGKARSAKSRKIGGGLRKNQRSKEFIVAFIGILRTSRRQRVNVAAIMRRHAESVGPFISSEIGRSR